MDMNTAEKFYFMAKARDYVKRKSAELGRPMTFFTQTFGWRMERGHSGTGKSAASGTGISLQLSLRAGTAIDGGSADDIRKRFL